MRDRSTHEEECQVEIGKRGPREDEIDGVVDELDLKVSVRADSVLGG